MLLAAVIAARLAVRLFSVHFCFRLPSPTASGGEEKKHPCRNHRRQPGQPEPSDYLFPRMHRTFGGVFPP